jgi:hypothetical protein
MIPTANAESAYSMENIGQMIQDLSHSDNAKVNDALKALILDLDEDKKKWENPSRGRMSRHCSASEQLPRQMYCQNSGSGPEGNYRQVTRSHPVLDLSSWRENSHFDRRSGSHCKGHELNCDLNPVVRYIQ